MTRINSPGFTFQCLIFEYGFWSKLRFPLGELFSVSWITYKEISFIMHSFQHPSILTSLRSYLINFAISYHLAIRFISFHLSNLCGPYHTFFREQSVCQCVHPSDGYIWRHTYQYAVCLKYSNSPSVNVLNN